VNLDEVAAPPPVYDPSEKSLQLNDYLENQQSELERDSQTSGRGSEHEPDRLQCPDQEPQEKHPKFRRISKFLQTSYIVSYLVLFSIIGTALRMVIESLT